MIPAEPLFRPGFLWLDFRWFLGASREVDEDGERTVDTKPGNPCGGARARGRSSELADCGVRPRSAAEARLRRRSGAVSDRVQNLWRAQRRPFQRDSDPA